MKAQDKIHITANRQLVEEAAVLAKMDNHRQLIELALQNFIAQQRQFKLLDLFGDGIREDYDYKVARFRQKWTSNSRRPIC